MLSAEIYDKSINWKKRFRNEIPLLKDLMSKCQINTQNSSEYTKILDMGCGSGNHLAQLNALIPEYSFSGIDISGNMLELAKNKAKEGNLQWNLIEGDFLASDFQDRKFNFIYSIGNSFLLMMQNRPLSSFFSKIEQILAPNGMFFIQILNNSNPRSGYFASPLFLTEQGDSFHTLKRFSPDRENNLMNVDFIEYLQMHDQKKPEISVNPSFWPLVTLDDMKKVVEKQGNLKILNAWSNYQRAAFDPKTSNDLIVLLQKA
ncbi:MAG: class I SAM-dependent methyltransferase [Promethearchaeota archaeon]